VYFFAFQSPKWATCSRTSVLSSGSYIISSRCNNHHSLSNVPQLLLFDYTLCSCTIISKYYCNTVFRHLRLTYYPTQNYLKVLYVLMLLQHPYVCVCVYIYIYIYIYIYVYICIVRSVFTKITNILNLCTYKKKHFGLCGVFRLFR
jgi:hypothetical protein